ncbi:MAG: hypothetical protein WBF90_12835 [Rivularia sp. (in: cyanobacteria)]
MLKFTIVSRTNYQDLNSSEEWKYYFPDYSEKSFSTRLRKDNTLSDAEKILLDKKNEENQLQQIEEDSETCPKIIHPISENESTVSLWKYKNQNDKYYVKDSGDAQAFNRPQMNLLYLPELRGKRLIDFRNATDYNEKYRYKVVELEELGFPNSVAAQNSSVNGVFFKQINSDEGINPEVIDLEYSKDIINNNKDEYSAVGWLNPLILTFSLDDNDIENIESTRGNRYLKALSLFLEPSALILVEPHIDRDYDLRIGFLIQLHQLIEERQRNHGNNHYLSLIEHILFGSQYIQPWKPFLILDLLGGEFYVYQNIKHNSDNEKLLISWNPPEDAKSNKLWFADYWLQKCENIIQQNINIQSQINIVPSPSSARVYRSGKGSIRFQVDDFSKTNLSLSSLISKHPCCTNDGNTTNLYNFLLELFQDSESEQFSEKFPYNDFWRIKTLQNKLVEFDEVDFWNYFSQNHVIPKSPLLIAIPKQDNRFLDPIASLNFGPYHFLWDLFNYFNGERQQEIVDFYNFLGWWNNWHSTLFNNRWDVCLNFIEKRGFIIKKSILARDCLGLYDNHVNWKYLNMRFSSFEPVKSNNLL